MYGANYLRVDTITCIIDDTSSNSIIYFIVRSRKFFEKKSFPSDFLYTYRNKVFT